MATLVDSFVIAIFYVLFQCRFVTKYRHCDGKLEVKITDDSVVGKLKTFIK